ncbi:MAG TPA: acyl-CoA dehydrogenase family protein [Kiritimatiellia bacterium]
MDFSFSREQLAVRDECLKFAHDEIAPVRERLEGDPAARTALFEKACAQGLFLLTVPAANGGRFVDTTAFTLGISALSRVDAGFGVSVGIMNVLLEGIARFGTDAQKKRYIENFISGEWATGAFAVTEDESGSDVRSMKTRAERSPSDPDTFVIRGEKCFITNGDIADVCFVFARTGDGPSDITCFLVEKGDPGWNVSGVHRKMGQTTVALVSLSFKDCRVSKDRVLGKVNDGFAVALAMLDSGRIGVAAQAIGLAEAAMEAAVGYAQKRVQFGKPIAKNQAVAFKLSDMQVKLEASKLLLYRACWLKDQGKPFGLETSIAKLHATESANEIANEAVQIHGGNGYIKDYPLERYYRDARVMTIYEGTSEIQRLVISRNILKDK